MNVPEEYSSLFDYYNSSTSYQSEVSTETSGAKIGLFLERSEEERKLYTYLEFFYTHFSNEFDDAFGDTAALSITIGLPIASKKFSFLGGLQMNYAFDADYYGTEDLYYFASLGARYKVYKNSFLKIDYNLPISNLNKTSDETVNFNYIGLSLGIAFK